VAKYDLRVECYGTLDETNAAIGLARLHTRATACHWTAGCGSGIGLLLMVPFLLWLILIASNIAKLPDLLGKS
jgi:hypothetical protein